MILKIENLNIKYDSSTVIDGIGFEMEKGDFVTIIGRSGVGKSSILNAIANFIPYNGNIEVYGRLGYVFQKNAIFPWMNVYDNLAFGTKLVGVDSKEKQNIIDEIAEVVGLSNFYKKYPFQLSGGQLQRLALAQAIVQKPDLLLLDECFANLDLITRDEIGVWMKEILLTKYKISVLMISHYINEAIYLSSKIVTLQNNKSLIIDKIDAQSTNNKNLSTLKHYFNSLLKY